MDSSMDNKLTAARLWSHEVTFQFQKKGVFRL
jgi:hypothetical protein